jgi:hypothetical protein
MPKFLNLILTNSYPPPPLIAYNYYTDTPHVASILEGLL